MLQKEFQILKNTFILSKYKAAIETTEKININDKSFDKDIKECLESNKSNKFLMFGKLKNIEEKK